jgi:antitoxin component YwqK of YwqJK toxin-antitoxin module
LEKQQLISERRHFKNGSLQMILDKIEDSDRYQVRYFYESGELYAFGQFDQYNRPSVIWTFFYQNGKKKEEGPVCTECIQKIWRPWTLFMPVYRQGLWTYYSKDGAIIKTVEKDER